MRIFSGFEEIKCAVGTEIGASEWVEITQDRLNKFAEATCDEQWIHVDQERASKEVPGGRKMRTGSCPSASRRCSSVPSWGSKASRTPSITERSGSDTCRPFRPEHLSEDAPPSRKPKRCRPTGCA